MKLISERIDKRLKPLIGKVPADSILVCDETCGFVGHENNVNGHWETENDFLYDCPECGERLGHLTLEEVDVLNALEKAPQ